MAPRMIPRIEPEEFSRRLAAGEPIYLIDVRQAWENDYCALPDSILIPLPELSSRLDEVTPPAGATVVVYCHHGIRSVTGAAILQQAGFASAASLEGGIDAWSLRIDAGVKRY